MTVTSDRWRLWVWGGEEGPNKRERGFSKFDVRHGGFALPYRVSFTAVVAADIVPVPRVFVTGRSSSMLVEVMGRTDGVWTTINAAWSAKLLNRFAESREENGWTLVSTCSRSRALRLTP